MDLHAKCALRRVIEGRISLSKLVVIERYIREKKEESGERERDVSILDLVPSDRLASSARAFYRAPARDESRTRKTRLRVRGSGKLNGPPRSRDGSPARTYARALKEPEREIQCYRSGKIARTRARRMRASERASETSFTRN